MRRGLAAAAGLAMAAMMAAPAGWSQNTQQAVNSAPRPAPRNIEMVPAKAWLNNGLNAKKAKAGDPVTARLEQAVTFPNEPSLPRNAVLEGKVDQVVASHDHSGSKIIVTFQRAKLKDGRVVPVKVTVMSVSSPQMGQGENAGGAMPDASAAGAPGPRGAGPGGGGPGAGAPESGPEPAPPVPAGGGPSPGVPPASALADQGGIPGVMLESSIHDSTSATFISTDRNVEVPGGTEMQLAIAIVPQGVKAQ